MTHRRFSGRSLWAIGVVAVLTAANVVRLFVLAPAYERVITDGFELVVVVVGTVTSLVATARSSRLPRALWATTALYFAATALGDAHDFLIDVGIRPPILLAATEAIGWCSYLPLACLVFFPLTDGLQRQRRWLSVIDFAQVTMAVALLYFRFVYLPHSESGVRWIVRGRPEMVRNILISVGLLLRAGLDPSRQARAVYRRVGGAFGVLTASYLLLGPFAAIARPAALLSLSLIAMFWQEGADAGNVSLRGLIVSRLALSICAAANLLVVELLATGAPAPYRPTMSLIAVVSIVLFIARAVLAEATRYGTERALRTSEERYATTFRASPDGIVLRDMGTERIVEANERLATMLGYAPGELVGRTLAELGVVAPRDAAAFFARVAEAGTVRDFEFDVRRRDGARLQMQASAELVDIGGRHCAVTIFRDVTAQKRVEAEVLAASEERRQLYVRLATVEDDERRVLHAELHDQVGANLSALRIELDVAASLLTHEDLPGARRHLGGAREVATETMAMARDLMAELRPPALDDFGLTAALRTFAEAQSSRLDLPIHVVGPDLARRPHPVVESAVFRIAQEAVINAARHASATCVTVEIGERDGCVMLAVADDGVGFDLERPGAGPDHWGLRNMRQRAQSVGGTLRVETAPGAGTRVTLEAPRETA